jgi:hypothetical protein
MFKEHEMLLSFVDQFGDDHYREIEELWAALVIGWPNNLRVIIHYLVILTNMAAAELLPFVSQTFYFVKLRKFCLFYPFLTVIFNV